jgi:peptide/nickel transport system permease protein
MTEQTETITVAEKGSSLGRDVLKRLLRHPTGLIGLGIIVLFILSAILAPLLSPGDPLKSNLRTRLIPPTLVMSGADLEARNLSRGDFPLGTDAQGRDLLRRVLYGGRISLRVGLAAVLMAMSVGTILGLIGGYWGGRIDLFIVWFIDILLAFPGILLAISIVAVLGPSLTNALIAISITQIPIYTRIVRSATLSLRESEYVQAALALGSRAPRIIFGHILPNSLSPLLVQITMSTGTAILDVAALGFLGLGAQPPAAEWGVMISDGYNRFREAPWLSIAPGLAIFFSVIGFNLLGDAARDALDPRLN